MTETTITWSIEYLDTSGYRCSISISNEDSKVVLDKSKVVIAYLEKLGVQPAPDLASTAATVATLAPPRPLEEGQKRMLITKIKRTDETQADLYGRGHRYPDTRLFDLSDLATVGIEFTDLPIGQEIPCRFFAVYTESDKKNKAGNSYKDVCWLEAA